MNDEGSSNMGNKQLSLNNWNSKFCRYNTKVASGTLYKKHRSSWQPFNMLRYARRPTVSRKAKE